MWQRNCERDNRISESLSNPVHNERPDPKPGMPTELIAVTAVPHEGFCHERWKGEGPVYDEHGNERTDVALDAREDEPERWVTDKTIYLKCLENENEQVAWAMSDMAALAGAAVKGTLSGGSKPTSRRVTSQYVAKYGVLIRGGGFEPSTKFNEAVSKLRFYKDVNAGYGTKLQYPLTLPQAIDAYIKEGVPNEPDYGGDYTFPGRVN